jgi:hypothetical protein
LPSASTEKNRRRMVEIVDGVLDSEDVLRRSSSRVIRERRHTVMGVARLPSRSGRTRMRSRRPLALVATDADLLL